jgi:hypothetical protein
MALGESKKDLVYTPLEPCRLFDTRFSASGAPLAAGSPGLSQAFTVAGASGFEAQGGNPGGCGVPIFATSVLINFVAVNPQGQGNLRGAPLHSSFPAAGGILTYQLLNPPLNISNGVLFPICDPTTVPPPGCVKDIVLAANGAGTHVVGTALGYAMRFPKEQVRSNVTQSWNSGTTAIGWGPTPGPGCTEYVGSTFPVFAPVVGKVWIRGNVMLKVAHTGGNVDGYYVWVSKSTDTPCGNTDTTAGKNYINMTGYASGTHHVNLPLDKVFSVAAGSTTDFKIYATDDNLTFDTAELWYDTLTAVFIPD